MKQTMARFGIAFALCLTWVGCDAPPRETPASTTASADVPTPTTTAAPVAKAPPLLTGFFEPGNFATVTVPSDTPSKPLTLSIKSLDVSVTVQGRMARTQVTQVFHNSTPRQTEGTYAFTLPEGASISRLAMDVEGKMMEGELVERERARMIYEGIVRKQKDPALLEWQGGNRFKTQIFPIPANGDKTVILTYEQFLPATGRQADYTYALPKLEGDVQSPIQNFNFALQATNAGQITIQGYDARVEGNRVAFSSQTFRPAGPLQVTFVTPTPDTRLGYGAWKNERFFAIDFVPTLPPRTERAARDLVLAIDTSAGIGQKELDHVQKAVRLLLDTLDTNANFQLLLGDTFLTSCTDAPTSKAQVAPALACLNDYTAGGATNLSALLDKAAEIAKATTRPTSIVLFTDGVASLGELDGDLLRERLKTRLGSATSLHTVAVGLAPNEDFLGELARVSGGHSVRMSPKQSAAAMVETLQPLIAEPLLTNITVTASGGKVEGLVPHHPFNLARNQRHAIMGRLDEGTASITIEGMYDGAAMRETFQLKFPETLRSENLLVNFWARAVIDGMQKGHVNREKVVKTSLHYGVMSRYTSFLVLENDEAYKRFNVERLREAEKERLNQLAKTDEGESEPQRTANITKSAEDLKTVLNKAPKKQADRLDPAVAAKPKPVVRDPVPEAEPADDEESRRMVELGKKRELAERVQEKTILNRIDSLNGERNEDQPRVESLRKELSVRDSDVRRERSQLKRKSTRLESKSRDRSVARKSDRRDDKDSKYGEYGYRGYMSNGSRVDIGELAVVGSLNTNDIRRALYARQRAIQMCYIQELKKNTELAGHIDLLFTMNQAGRVLKARAKLNTTGNKTLARCISARLRSWKFPSVGGSERVDVTLSLRFVPYRGFNNLAQQIKDMEARKSDNLEDMTALFELYAQASNRAKAKALLGKIKKSVPKDAQLDTLFPLVFSAENLLKTEFFSITRQLIARRPSDRSAVNAMFSHLTNAKRWNELFKELGKAQIDPGTAADLNEVLYQMNRKSEADALLVSWIADMSLDQQLQTLTNNGYTGKRYPKQLFQITHALLQKDDTRTEVMDHHVNAALALKKDGDIVGAVVKRCKAGKDQQHHCTRWLNKLAAHTSAQTLLVTYHAKTIEKLRQQRTLDIANPALIHELSKLLRLIGQSKQADRVLSERVEFAPHDWGARIDYANALGRLGQTLSSCAQMSLAVQLNPAKRDTFKEMMTLRRNHVQHSDALYRCITEGVSKLPVQRAVSLVMTWEDDSADVDLHITEASGEHVWYQDREAESGGLLYYDITDGFGPEIYVLGSGPKGEYKLEVVYYSGTKANVRGTLTILRNAGSPSETREERPFTLPNPNKKSRIPLGSFRL